MKYRMMQKVMWLAFKGTYKNALGSVLHIQNPTEIMQESHKKYKKILENVNDFAKGDNFYINILSCAMFAAVMLSLDELPSLEDATAYYQTAMDENFFMRFSAAHSNNYTEKGRKKLKDRAAKSERWYRENPYTWIFTVEDGETINQYTATFKTCGILKLMQELHLEQLTPALCKYDYNMAAMNNTKFTRNFTLAGGGKYCDCHYDHREKM